MSGSRLGRGRGGRLAVYGGCCVVLVLVVFLYRAATTEMARLRELQVQCSHQQEALAAQLQVIFEYKVRLEKSLAEEKGSNSAMKLELQERASREKSLRDKDSLEALQKYNSLQQQHKMLKSEHQDLREECEKRQKQAQDDSMRLETTLQDLRSQINNAKEDKRKSLEHLKSEYLKIDTEKTLIEEKYNDLLKNQGNTDSTIEHLKKEVFELKRELAETKLSCKGSPSEFGFSNNPKPSQSASQPSVARLPPLQQAFQQQNNPVTSMSKISTAVSSTKSSVSSASTSSNKSPNAETPVKLAARVKLPVGVVPIPEIIEPKIDKDDSKKALTERKSPDDKRKTMNAEANVADDDRNAGRHVGEQILERQENPGWFKVKPGVQEIGDEPNNLRRIISDLDGAVHQGNDQNGDEQYGIDYYKEAPAKNNDIHLDEGEEDEAEDEEDYQNNPRADKHE